MSYLRDQLPSATTPLQKLVRHAYTHSAFYRERFDAAGLRPLTIYGLTELQALPTTTRRDLQNDPWRLLAVPKEDIVQTHVSTGTTGGEDVYIHFDWDDLYSRGLGAMLGDGTGHKLLAIEPGEIVFNALPYEVSVTGLAIHRALQDGPGACLVPLGKGGFYSAPAKAAKMMAELRGEHLFTTPFYALHLAQVARDCGIDAIAQIALKKIWLVGEACSDALRRRIEALWGCSAFLYYGSLECGVIGLECPLQNGFHIASGLAAVELRDSPASAVNLSGVTPGEVITTALWRYASPLIRYESGDLGYWDHRACGCRLPGPRLHLLGRKNDVLTVDGKELYALEVEQVLLDELPGLSAWFGLRAECGALVVEVPTTTGDWSPSSAQVDRVSERLDALVLFENCESAPYLGGKVRRVKQGEAK